MAAGVGPNHRPLNREENLLRDTRNCLIGLLECVNAEARGVRHIRTPDALRGATAMVGQVDRAMGDYRTELGDQPLLARLRAVILTLADCLRSELRGADPRTPHVIADGIGAVSRCEQALNAYRKGNG